MYLLTCLLSFIPFFPPTPPKDTADDSVAGVLVFRTTILTPDHGSQEKASISHFVKAFLDFQLDHFF